MKLLFICALFMITVAYVYGALFRLKPDPTPGHPGHCNSNITGPMENGEKKTIEGRCARASCYNDGFITIATCGVVDGPCGVTDEDLSKPYPDCCPRASRTC